MIESEIVNTLYLLTYVVLFFITCNRVSDKLAENPMKEEWGDLGKLFAGVMLSIVLILTVGIKMYAGLYIGKMLMPYIVG